MSFDHNFHSIVVTLGFSFTICLAKKSVVYLILLEESFDALRTINDEPPRGHILTIAYESKVND